MDALGPRKARTPRAPREIVSIVERENELLLPRVGHASTRIHEAVDIHVTARTLRVRRRAIDVAIEAARALPKK